ncbi:MAG: hypothetical protein M4579_007044 [Chaenotheca gracillima]|nr:MAG: hypothetical protein M4579_007044 [Chaenotheca gracillima]
MKSTCALIVLVGLGVVSGAPSGQPSGDGSLEARQDPYWIQEPTFESSGKRSVEARQDPYWISEPTIESSRKRDVEVVDSSLVKRQDGRYCDFSEGIYEDYGYLQTNFQWFCNKVDGLIVPKGDRLSAVCTFQTGRSAVYIKYQNDHASEGWPIKRGDCYATLTNIMVGCTPGGANPADPVDQRSDGGTFYFPSTGSIDFQNQ